MQLLRYRAPGFGKKGSKSAALGPMKTGDKGDGLHMHVDQDKEVHSVVLLSLGATVLFALDDQSACKRYKACNAAMGKGVRPAEKVAALRTECESCKVIEMRSGDVLVFDGHPDRGIAHGVLTGAAPE